MQVAKNNNDDMNKLKIYFRSPTQYLKCPKVNVSNAGAGDGVYLVSSQHSTSWAPNRQVYQHENKHRWVMTWLIIPG